MFGQPEPLLGFILVMSFYSSASLAANPMLAVSALLFVIVWFSKSYKNESLIITLSLNPFHRSYQSALKENPNLTYGEFERNRLDKEFKFAFLFFWLCLIFSSLVRLFR